MKFTQFTRQQVKASGLTINRNHAIISLAVANPHTLAHAFKAVNKKISGKVGHGRIIIDLNEPDGLPAIAIIRGEEFDLMNPHTWDILLSRAVWIDKRNGNEYKEHGEYIGKYKDWWIAYSSVDKIIDVYYDEDTFMELEAPIMHDINYRKTKI
jgi:hypothetical protein